MLLLTEDGNILSHSEVEELEKTEAGSSRISQLFLRNRSLDAAIRVVSFLYSSGLVAKMNSTQSQIIYSIINNTITAPEEAQDDFVLEMASNNNSEMNN